jgi:hypothetical protein
MRNIGDAAQSLAGALLLNQQGVNRDENMVASMQTMRTEMTAELDKLRKFMDAS